MKSRSSIVFYINQQRHEVSGEQALMTLSDFLRYEQNLTGTKVVCAEGDCGACTVLKASVHELSKNRFVFKAVNSCILPLLCLDGCQIITVEGLQKKEVLHPVQQSMIENFGSQCGYCTPGFICSMVGLVEDSILNEKKITEKRVKNYLTGNLCRCTGYDPIIKAALAIRLTDVEALQDRYSDFQKIKDLKNLVKQSVEILMPEYKVFLPTNLKEALKIKKKYSETKIVAGATDLGVAVNKGRMHYNTVMSLQNIESLWRIKKNKKTLIIPCRTTLSELQKFLENQFPEMGRMLNLFASPQIKNSGTLVGNIVNASPISDTIPFLMVNDAVVEVHNITSKKLIPLTKFYLGYKKLNLKSSELVTAIHLPIHKGNQISKLYKVSLRKDLDISAITMALRLQLKDQKIIEARLAFGGVGPTVLRLKKIESSWIGKILTPELIKKSADEVTRYVSPLSDVRGTKEYRQLLCKNLLKKMADEMEISR